MSAIDLKSPQNSSYWLWITIALEVITTTLQRFIGHLIIVPEFFYVLCFKCFHLSREKIGICFVANYILVGVLNSSCPHSCNIGHTALGLWHEIFRKDQLSMKLIPNVRIKWAYSRHLSIML